MSASWLVQLVPMPGDRLPLSLDTFLTRLVPAFACYYAMAVLVQLRGTMLIRAALLPVSLWTAFRGATTLDVTLDRDDLGLIHWNLGLCLGLFAISMRIMEWTLCFEPLRRTHIAQVGKETAVHGSPSPSDTPGLMMLLRDACDLCTNLRGLGWNSSTGLYIPPETRPVTSTPAFVRATFLSLVRSFIIFDFLQCVILYIHPSADYNIGGTIFDPALTPLHRYTRSFFITHLALIMLPCGIEIVYTVGTLVGILILQQSPGQWPPLLEQPMKSTSHTSFWAKRWHQTFRSMFLALGGKPLELWFGRTGLLFGAFFMSGWLHSWGTWGLGQGAEFWNVVTAFIMMAVGIILERAWKKVSGVRVGGVIGWVWWVVWGTLWMQLMIDPWCRGGMIGAKFLPERIRPSKVVVSYLLRALSS